MSALSHERCVQRCCCPSWSCTPHDPRCEHSPPFRAGGAVPRVAKTIIGIPPELLLGRRR